MDDWDDDRKQRYVIAVGEGGYDHADVTDDPDSVNLDIYPVESLRELAIQFVEDGLFGEISETLYCYINYDAIARDLALDYTETVIAGDRLIYRHF